MDEKLEKPTNILFIDNGLGPGGSYKSMLALAANIDPAEYKYHMVIPYDWPVPEEAKSKSIVLVMRPDIIRKAISMRLVAYLVFIFNFLFAGLPYIARLYFYCRKNKIKIVHLNNDLLSDYAGVLLAQLLGVPCIAHIRGSIKNLLSTRLLAKYVDKFIVVSNFIKQYPLGLGIPESDVEMIYNAFLISPEGKSVAAINEGRLKIDVVYDGFSFDKNQDFNVQNLKQELKIAPDIPVIGEIAMLTPWKGQKIFIKAAARILKEMPECKALIVGDAPTAERGQGYKEELTLLCSELGISDNVIFTGHRNDILRFYKLLDVVVNASIVDDPLPGVVIYGMAMGKPVVASRCGGIPEMIENGKNGLLFEPGNVEELSDAIIDLLRNKEKREQLGKNAHETYMQKFTVDKMLNEICEVYEQVLSKYNQAGQ